MNTIEALEWAKTQREECEKRGESQTPYGHALQQLAAEVKTLRKDRATVKSYLQAVASYAALHPDGYTIADFQQVRLDQERAANAKLRAALLRIEMFCEKEMTQCDPFCCRDYLVEIRKMALLDDLS